MRRALGALLACMLIAACGDTNHPAQPATVTVTDTVPASTTTTSAALLPGSGRPPIIVGDMNTTEQFVLGQLYYQALRAQGYSASLDRNIGTTAITLQGLQQGVISFYPEYLNTWDRDVAGLTRSFRNTKSAYLAGQRYAIAHGYQLLDPTPFSDTSALAVEFNYGLQNHLDAIGDLRAIGAPVTLGAPPQFRTDPYGLAAVTRAYAWIPAAFTGLLTGGEYAALDSGSVEVADVNTTDGQLITGNYTLLRDPLHVFGFGNAVPVVPLKVLQAEGPQFAATINRVSALLTTAVIRQLNAAVDIDHQDPATVGAQFLSQHGLLAPATP